jgi:dTDP-4-dehydrorhamnose 3,5-epimerase
MIEPVTYRDTRGWFMETWNAEQFVALGLPGVFVQDNHSVSHAGVLRGLHYQTQLPQGKLVRTVVGEIFDVAVDLRAGSPTVGRWVGALLSAENRRQVYIPAGFAHGFYVTRGPAEVLYKCTERYAPQFERTLRWDDPRVGIQWPLRGGPPVVSAKDAAGGSLDSADLYTELPASAAAHP